MSQEPQGASPTQDATRPFQIPADAHAAAQEALAIIEGPDATVGVGAKLPTSTGSQPVQEEVMAPDATMALGMDSPARKSGGYALSPNPQPTASIRKPFPWMMVGLVAGGVVTLGVVGLLALKFSSKAEAPVEVAPAPVAEPVIEDVPPALRGPLAKAQGGDAKAMHLLGTMYYNGLNCTQNREEGLKWLRKAADAGNTAAKKDLAQMNQAVPAKKP